MNLRLVLRVVSILVLIIAGFMLFPVIVALYYNETHLIASFLIPIALTVSVTLIYLFLTRREEGFLSTKAGFFLVTVSWLLASIVGALPLYLSGVIPSYTDAFFETMSGFTTTGASILTEIESLPRSILFWRSLTHWLGGMGIVVFTVAVFPLLGIGGMQLMQAEAPGPTVDKITPKITETAKILWIIYGGMTVLETALLMIGGMDLYDALTHTFGTLATGGFSPKNASVGHFDSAFIDGVITVFMLMAGVNFILYFRMLTGRFTYVRKNTEVRAYLGIYIVATVIATVGLFGHQYPTIGESLRHAAFQTASILTTTGYATADFAAWPAVAQAALFVLMFIGGSTGSTGGGMKVLRIVTAIRQGINEMRYLVYPRGVFGVKINGSNVRKDVVYAITGFIFLYLTALLLVTLIVATAGNSILTSLSTALAMVGNIGPGFGEVGPTENYAFFPVHIKWILSFAMMLGRLELYTVLVLFTPGFWRR